MLRTYLNQLEEEEQFLQVRSSKVYRSTSCLLDYQSRNSLLQFHQQNYTSLYIFYVLVAFLKLKPNDIQDPSHSHNLHHSIHRLKLELYKLFQKEVRCFFSKRGWCHNQNEKHMILLKFLLSKFHYHIFTPYINESISTICLLLNFI